MVRLRQRTTGRSPVRERIGLASASDRRIIGEPFFMSARHGCFTVTCHGLTGTDDETENGGETCSIPSMQREAIPSRSCAPCCAISTGSRPPGQERGKSGRVTMPECYLWLSDNTELCEKFNKEHEAVWEGKAKSKKADTTIDKHGKSEG